MRCSSKCITFNTHAARGSRGQGPGEMSGLNLESPELISACRAHLLTSIIILLPPLSLPGSRLSFALKQSKPQTNIRTSTGAHTHLHNSALKSGFPIAPAHTKQNVSSDYRYCSLLASGVSILNLLSFSLLFMTN